MLTPSTPSSPLGGTVGHVDPLYSEITPGYVEHGRSIYPVASISAPCGYCGGPVDSYRWGDCPERVERDCLVCGSEFISREPLNGHL